MVDDTKAVLPDFVQTDQAAGHPDQPTTAGNSQVEKAGLNSKDRTAKQRQASPINGRKSQGPKSPNGKQRAAQNAVRDGIFSRQIVVRELGETREQFDDLKRSVFECIQPEGALEAQWAMDLTENLFVRERVRRAEEAERNNRLKAFQLENELRRSDELGELKQRFVVQLEDHVCNIDPSFPETPEDLEKTRRELMSTSEGVDFLLELLDRVEDSVKDRGVLSAQQALLFKVIRGSDYPVDVLNRIDRLILEDYSAANSTGAAEPSEREIDAHGNDVPEDDNVWPAGSEILSKARVIFINAVGELLRERKEKLKMIEDAETQKQITLIMLDPSPCERFSRAETSRERKMYRAFAAITSLRSTTASSPVSLLLPGRTEQKELPGQPEPSLESTEEPAMIQAQHATIPENVPVQLFNKEVSPPAS